MELVERVEAADLSEEDVEDMEIVDHVRRWVDQSQEYLFTRPRTPTDSAGGNLGVTERGHGVNTQDAATSISEASLTADVIVTPDDDVRPSTSGMTASSKVRKRSLNDGSELDSDYDDEFDVMPIERATSTCLRRDIPDDEELEAPSRNVIVNIERGIDDEADRLLGLSSSFTWVEGFETFRGVPETFSGPTPGPVKTYESVYDVFVDIFDKDIIELMVRETNRYTKQTIDQMKESGTLKPHSRLHEWTDTDADEMYVLLAVFMYMGIDPRTTLREYWTLGGYLELTRFSQLMFYSRYILLNKFLHFVDNSDESKLSIKCRCTVVAEINETFPFY